MPFLVPVEIRQSPLHGLGVYALQDIPQGSIVWAMESEYSIPIVGYQPQQNRVLSQEQLLSLPPQEARRVLIGGYSEPEYNQFIDPRDGTQFTNHSSHNFNTKGVSNNYNSYSEYKTKAIRDTKKGEEITQSYFGYLSLQPQWVVDLIAKYCPEKLEFEKRLFTEKQQLKKVK